MNLKAYCINLDRRPERWARTQELWSPYFDLVRVSAVDTPSNGAIGCKGSHNLTAEKALQHSNVGIILEDDAVPTEHFNRIGMECIDEAIAHVNEWDVIFCGPYLDLRPVGMARASLSKTLSPMFLGASYAHQTHFMLYNDKSLPLLGASLGSNLPIDMFIARSNARKWIPIRLLATQADGESDVGHAFKGAALLYKLSAEMLEQKVPDINLVKT